MVYCASCGRNFENDGIGEQHERDCPACFAAKHPSLAVDIDAILKGPEFANFTPRDWIDLALAAIDQAVPIGEVGKAVKIIERYRDDY